MPAARTDGAGLRYIMSEVTGIPSAAGKRLPLVYDELHRLAAQKLARERPCHTPSATALVHEAYLRLVGEQEFDSSHCRLVERRLGVEPDLRKHLAGKGHTRGGE
jgi:hypothetical protein